MRRRRRTPAAWRNNLIGVKWRFLKDGPLVQARTPVPNNPNLPHVDFDIQQYASLLDDLDDVPITNVEQNALSGVTQTEEPVMAGAKLESENPASSSSEGETDDEDDECESADYNSAADRSRSPSPVIIWRPSTRVHIASNLPPQLKSVFCRESRSHGPAQPPSSRRSPRRDRTRSRPQACVFYSTVGVEKCKTKPKRKSLVDSDISDIEEEIVANPQRMERRDCERLADVSAQIPNLFISKAYKGFIKEQPADNNRIPYYLRNTVEYRSTNQ